MTKPWMKIANSRIGVKEVKGSQDNLEIVGYFADVGHGWVKDDETAWCAAFVGSCLELAGHVSTRALNARSYLNWGRKIETPVEGCVVIFWRDNPGSWKGHVSFVTRWDDKYIWCLGGNQHNEVRETRYLRAKVLGYRLPKTKLTSKTNWAAATGGVGVLASQTDAIGGMMDKWNEISEKGGDFVDKFGSIIDSSWFPFIAIGVVLVLGYIIIERNKKVDEHGL